MSVCLLTKILYFKVFSLILQAERCGKDVIFNSSFNDFTLFAVKNGFRLFFEDFSGYFQGFSPVKITVKSSESAGKTILNLLRTLYNFILPASFSSRQDV